MADAASRAKLKALAEYFRKGGNDPEVIKNFREDPVRPTGRLSAADQMPQKPVASVPSWGMHDTSAPEMNNAGAGSMDDMAAVRQKQLALSNARSQDLLNDQQGPDLSGYSQVTPQDIQRIQATQDMPIQNPKFQRLKQQLQPKDVRDSLHGLVEVTPELEKQLGYGSQDEDEEKKQRALNNNNRAGSAEGSYSGS